MTMTSAGPTFTLDGIRDCFEGVLPSWIATCAPDGTPNVTPLSQVNYVDSDHVALSHQFFNKTRENILANPHAQVMVIDPGTAAIYRLSIQYLRTETAGPLFESMKAKLAGIAQHTGMAGVFRLLGSDVYRVHRIELAPSGRLEAPPARRSLLSLTRSCARALVDASDLAALLDRLLGELSASFAIAHAMVLMLDESGERLYTVASRGYAVSGIGSEIPLGQGVIGVAARERTPIRITHMTAEYVYSRAIRESVSALGLKDALETAIPLPGLARPASQLAVPILAGHCLFGVLFVESSEDLRFRYEEEDALVILAAQLATALQGWRQAAPSPEAAAAQREKSRAFAGPPAALRHYAADDSVFIDQDYLIKGVAGAIFWALVGDYVTSGRTEFSNRELRLDPRIRLPEGAENLEARLILLERRLAERCTFLRLEKCGRGRIHLAVERPLKLLEMKG